MMELKRYHFKVLLFQIQSMIDMSQAYWDEPVQLKNLNWFVNNLWQS